MDPIAYAPYAAQALGGALAGNVLGGLTRGGGGMIGRTLLGALGGVAAGYGAPHLAQAQDFVTAARTLLEGRAGALLGDGIVGAVGGAAFGLIGGLLIRPRS